MIADEAWRRHMVRTMRPALLATFGLAVALYAQWILDRWRDTPSLSDGGILFVLAAVLWALGIRRIVTAPLAEPPAAPDASKATEATEATETIESFGMDARSRRWFAWGLALILLTTVAAPWVAKTLPIFGGLAILRYPGGAPWPWRSNNALTSLGTLMWLGGVAFVIAALRDRRPLDPRAWLAWRPSASRWTWLLLAIIVVALFFRFWDLSGLPREMTSDHTEKLLDIHDVLQGARPIFLDQNAGREPLQFYLTALLIRLGFPYGFLAEKFFIALVSLAAVPAVYFAGREVGGRRLGLASAAVLAVAPWHVQIARAAMRVSFATLFTALTLFCLLRALRTGARNHWLALGIVLGTGMYGYTAFRPMAIVVAVVVVAVAAHDAWIARRGGGNAWLVAGRRIVLEATVAAVVAILIAAPLIRYAVDQPASFNQRTLSRITGSEVPLQNPPLVQFRINMTRAALMVNETVDSGWIHSPPNRPGLETTGGALFVLGLLTALLLALFARDWRLGIVLAALPMMLMSSALALAFPGEVPHLGRAAGALPMVAILAGLPLVILPEVWRLSLGHTAGRAAQAAMVLLAAAMAFGAWPRVFDEYRASYDDATLNTSDGVAVARLFMATGGDLDHVWVVGWPHGWDYRVIGIALGDPTRNALLWDEESGGLLSARKAAAHVDDPAPKLYLVGGSDAARSVSILEEIFPDARASRHEGRMPGKAFWSVYVPPTTEATP